MTVRSHRTLRSLLGLAAISGVAALANLSAAQEADDGYNEPGPYGEQAVLPPPVAGAKLRSAVKTCKLDLGPAQLDVTLNAHTHEPFDPHHPGDAIAELTDARQRVYPTLIRDRKPQVQITAVCSTSAEVRDDEDFTSAFMPLVNAPDAIHYCPDAKPYLISAACRTRTLRASSPDAGVVDAGATQDVPTDEETSEALYTNHAVADANVE